MTDAPRPRRRGLFELIADLPSLVADLVASEIALFRAEITAKAKSLGVGAGLLAGALVAVLYVVGFLLLAVVFALALVMPPWAAALVVAGVLLLVAAILGAIGYRAVKKGYPPLPTESIASLREDVKAIRGLGDFGRFARSRAQRASGRYPTSKEAP